jgi:hypothetical protein
MFIDVRLGGIGLNHGTQRFLSFIAFNPLVRFAMVLEAVALLFHGASMIVSIYYRYCTVITDPDIDS